MSLPQMEGTRNWHMPIMGQKVCWITKAEIQHVKVVRPKAEFLLFGLTRSEAHFEEKNLAW